MRYIDFDALKNTETSANIIESVRQIWENGNEWRGFSRSDRPMSGISVFVSDVCAEYTFFARAGVTVGRGDIVYIPRGERYKVRFIGGGSNPDVYTVNFDLLDKEGEELLLAKELTVFPSSSSIALEEAAARLCDAMLFEESRLKIQSFFFGLLDALCSAISRQREEYNPVSKGAELICAEWNKNRKISEYARMCGVSEGGFYLHFKKHYGKSPVEYRNGIRINTAVSLLTNTDLDISEIALRCGFEDAYYFSRIFKKSVGLSPRGYRRKAL